MTPAGVLNYTGYLGAGGIVSFKGMVRLLARDWSAIVDDPRTSAFSLDLAVRATSRRGHYPVSASSQVEVLLHKALTHPHVSARTLQRWVRESPFSWDDEAVAHTLARLGRMMPGAAKDYHTLVRYRRARWGFSAVPQLHRAVTNPAVDTSAEVLHEIATVFSVNWMECDNYLSRLVRSRGVTEREAEEMRYYFVDVGGDLKEIECLLQAVAQHPNTSVETFRSLWSDSRDTLVPGMEVEVQRMVLRSPRCPADLLSEACRSGRLSEAQLASRHPACPPADAVYAALRYGDMR